MQPPHVPGDRNEERRGGDTTRVGNARVVSVVAFHDMVRRWRFTANAAHDESTSTMTFPLATRCRLDTPATIVALASRRLVNALTGARFIFLEGTPAFLGRAR